MGLSSVKSILRHISSNERFTQFTRPGKQPHNELERSTLFFMGKSTISMAIFNRFLLVYQRVYPINIPLNHYKIPLNPIKPPFSYGFPMVSQVFPGPRATRAGGRPHHRGQRLVAERWRGGAGAAERQQGAGHGHQPRGTWLGGDGWIYRGMSENGVYPQWNSHLVGIMIINHWV